MKGANMGGPPKDAPVLYNEGEPKKPGDKMKRIRLSKAIREETYAEISGRLKDAYARVVAFWIEVLDDESAGIQNRMAASDRLAAYSVGKPATRETGTETDVDTVRAITEARKALEAKKAETSVLLGRQEIAPPGGSER